MRGPHLESPKEPVLGKSQNTCCKWMYEKATPIGSMEEIRKKTVDMVNIPLYHIIYKVLIVHPNGGWEWDFRTISSRTSICFTYMDPTKT